MLLKSEIEACYNEQAVQIKKIERGLERQKIKEINLHPELITIITGIRRCGKSTLLYQLIHGLQDDEFVFMNFEDPRLIGFEISDFEKLNEIIGDKKFYFFDEIQNVDKWEIFIRKLHDQKKTICLTGSNASLLSKELGTRLTGRNISKELFPFDYIEYCNFRNIQSTPSNFELFLLKGGFPSFLITDNTDYLQQLFRDIIYRDIIVRYGIRNSRVVEELALFLFSNIGKEYSLNSLKKSFNIGSANSVSDYITWFEESYLFFSLPRFSWSLKSVSVNPKKIYSIDTGLAKANSLSLSHDNGRLFENSVYIQLRRKYKTLFYFREKGECDFIIQDKNTITQAIQVCYKLHSDNYKREVDGLLEAMNFFNLNEGLIITLDQQDVLKLDNKTISLVKADEWFNQVL